MGPKDAGRIFVVWINAAKTFWIGVASRFRNGTVAVEIAFVRSTHFRLPWAALPMRDFDIDDVIARIGRL